MAWWFEDDPDRFAFELRKLGESGFSFSVTDDGKETGILRLKIDYKDWDDKEEPGRIHALIVVFPPTYPEFPFEIMAPTFPEGEHINPKSGLCLLQDVGNKWDGSRDYLAAFLNRQVKDILRSHRGDTTVLEADEGLRQTGYVDYNPGSAMVVADWSIPPEVERGYFYWRRFPGDPANRLVRGVVSRIESEVGPLGELNLGETWATWLQRSQELRGRWVRVPTIPRTQDPLKVAIEAWPELAEPADGAELIGLLIPEKKDKSGTPIDNWVFVLRVPVALDSSDGPKQALAHVFVRAEQFSDETKWARAPRAIPLASKKAVVVGMGAIGAPIARQLARSGIGHLTCVDYDSVQIGNLTRWEHGMPMLGDSKVHCMALNLERSYPPLKVVPIEYHIGSVDSSDATYGKLLRAIEEADLVIDATAELSVNRYIETVAREHEVPFVWAYGTPGGWGGIVGRHIPSQSEGCYECFRHRLGDATTAIQQGDDPPRSSIVPPPAEELPDVQPVGCFHPTFRGTGFDMDQISLMATRLAVATLCRGAPTETESYPDFPWDIAVLSQWHPQGKGHGIPTPPNWKTYTLDRHPDCDYHDD